MHGFDRQRQRRAVTLGGQLYIRGKCGLRPPIAVVVRFDARDHCADVRGLGHLVAEDLGQIGFISPRVQAELEMLRADPSDMQGGEVARRANGKRQIEVHQVSVGGMRVRWGERGQAAIPSRGVVVLRVEAL